jgi:aromatic-L-amino-acid decarboxylase
MSDRNPMFLHDESLTSLIFDYCRRRLALDPVPLDRPGTRVELDAALEGLITEQAQDPRRVLKVFEEHLAPAVVSCDSPRFLAFIPAAPTKASLLFDMVVSCSSLQGSSWLEAAGAVAAENQALRVIADLAGLPAGAGGCFVSGGSAANLSALAVAREVAGAKGSPGPLRVAVSEEAHSSITKALSLLGMEPLQVPTDDHRLTGAALNRALRADGSPDTVVAVATTAGTTNAGVIDDLDGIANVAAERGMWMHVDAAYGGAALLSRTARPLFSGIERADSLVVDPHKWLFAPFDCAALLYRQPELARLVHAQEASYLEATRGDPEEVWNPSDYAYHLTRRARGLALWFSLAVNGLDAYRRAVDAALETARFAAEAIDQRDYLELVMPPTLSIVLFHRIGWTESDYYAWARQLLSDQIALVTPTRWKGKAVARLVFLHPDTSNAIVEEILETMRQQPASVNTQNSS